ncbi:MAG: APC family permease [Fretibacterium sp.]|nr:APC family permease [Fretibacterium sp.]
MNKCVAEEKRLEQGLTPFNAWALAFGCTIGWAAFVMPGTLFLKQAGPLGSMIAIQIGLFALLLISFCYSYMLNKFPFGSGGYAYIQKAFGRGVGFICSWFLGLCYLCLIPLNATALGTMGRVLFNGKFQFGFHYTFAGYEIYMGELILAITPLVLLALLGAVKVNVIGSIQTVFAVVLLAGVMVMVLSALFQPRSLTGNLYPMFQTDGNLPLQIIAVALTAPQFFMGFHTMPQFAEERKFSPDWGKVITDTSLICSAFVYIALVFLAASVPVGYLDWRGYIYDLPHKRGITSMPTLFASVHLLGDAGLWVWGITVTSALLTCIIGFYVAASRLMYSMARNNMLPGWFAKLNRNNVPFHATLFCMAVSILAALMGRNMLNWTFDMASLGGVVCMACTCLAARKFALEEGRKDIIILGTLGFLLSAVMTFFLLIPIPALGCSIAAKSYICLILWSALGAFFFLSRRHKLNTVEPGCQNERESSS